MKMKVTQVLFLSSLYMNVFSMDGPPKTAVATSGSSGDLLARSSVTHSSSPQPKSPIKKLASLMRKASAVTVEPDTRESARLAYESCTGCNLDALNKSKAKQRDPVIKAIDEQLKKLSEEDPEKYQLVLTEIKKSSPTKESEK